MVISVYQSSTGGWRQEDAQGLHVSARICYMLDLGKAIGDELLSLMQ